MGNKFVFFSITFLFGVLSLADYGGCYIEGSADAKLTIVEFSDFACPYCASAKKMMTDTLRDFPGQVKFVYRNLPRPAHGPIAVTAAKAFLAVCLQNSSLAGQYFSEIFDHQDQLTEEYLFQTAKKIGINIDKMKNDMAGVEVIQRLQDDKDAASAHELGKTPSFIIGTQNIVGLYSYDDFKKFINRELQHR